MASLPEHLMPVSVGREPLSREVMEAHQRDRILAIATDVFAKRGYRSTTVDHIVAAAKIGVGSFYALFEGKEDCFIAAYDRIIADGRKQIAATLPSDGSWPEEVVAVLHALLELVSSRHLQARLALVEVQTAGPEAMVHYEATLDLIVPHLRRGREFSPIAAELPETLETATIGGLLWLLQQRILTTEFEPSEQLLAELVEIVAGPYLGEAETQKLLAQI